MLVGWLIFNCFGYSMEYIVFLILFIVALRLTIRLVQKTSHTLLNCRWYINKYFIVARGMAGLSKGEFAVYWGCLDLLLILPFISPFLPRFLQSNLQWLALLIVITPLLYSVKWIIHRSLSIPALLSVLAICVAAIGVVVAQMVSILLNVLVLFTTSPNYRGKVYYMPIKPY